MISEVSCVHRRLGPHGSFEELDVPNQVDATCQYTQVVYFTARVVGTQPCVSQGFESIHRGQVVGLQQIAKKKRQPSFRTVFPPGTHHYP